MLFRSHGGPMTAIEHSVGGAPSGIAGWLVLPAIGIVIGPPLIIFLSLKDIVPAFEIVPTGTSVYYLLVIETITTLAVAGFGFYTAWQFFHKRSRTPSLYIIFLVIQMVVVLVDSILVYLVLEVPVFDMETTRTLGRQIVAAVIWIPYFRSSRRVKNTFVK